MNMTEVKALILTYLGMSALTIMTCLVLGALEASGTAWGLALCLLAGLGGFLMSLVVMHYTPPEQRQRSRGG
jgi:hypothetical protein